MYSGYGASAQPWERSTGRVAVDRRQDPLTRGLAREPASLPTSPATSGYDVATSRRPSSAVTRSAVGGVGAGSSAGAAAASRYDRNDDYYDYDDRDGRGSR